MNTSKVCHLMVVALALSCLATPLPAQAPDDTVQVGDRILLHVEGEPQLSDTFTVSVGPALVLAAVGEVALTNVRRADVEPYLARELAQFLNAPVVHARVLVRLAVLGEVERPGTRRPRDHPDPGDHDRGRPHSRREVSSCASSATALLSGRGGPCRIDESGLTVNQMNLRSLIIVVPRRGLAPSSAWRVAHDPRGDLRIDQDVLTPRASACLRHQSRGVRADFASASLRQLTGTRGGLVAAAPRALFWCVENAPGAQLCRTRVLGTSS
jgi:hypothetical protein